MNSAHPKPVVASSPTRLFTIREVATIAGVSVMTVRRWIDDHGLRVHRFGRRVVRVSQTDLNSFFSGTRRQQNQQDERTK
jgi:excisionase family DNA binding protein